MSVRHVGDDREATETEKALVHAQQIAETLQSVVDNIEAAYKRMYHDTVSHTHGLVENCIDSGNNLGASIAIIGMIQTIYLGHNMRDFELTRAFGAIDNRFQSILDCVHSLRRVSNSQPVLGSIAHASNGGDVVVVPAADAATMAPEGTTEGRMLSLLGDFAPPTRTTTRLSTAIHESMRKMVDGLSSNHRSLLDTVVTQSVFCPSVLSLHGIHHPLMTIYSTALDTTWDPLKTMVFSNPGFLSQTMIAETCRYQNSHNEDTNEPPLQHLFTMVHVMSKMGFGAQDIEHLGPVFDQTFARRVTSSAEGLQYLQSSVVKIHCYPAVFKELIRRFFDAQQLGRCIMPIFRKDRATREEVGGVLSWMKNYQRHVMNREPLPTPSGRVTVLWGLQQRIEAATTESRSWFPSIAPTPWHRVALVEGAFKQALREIESRDSDRGSEGQELVDLIGSDSSPVWVMRAFPVVLRMHAVTHIKECIWNLKFIPPTPEMFLFTGILHVDRDDEADSVTASLQQWIDSNPWYSKTTVPKSLSSLSDILQERGVDVSYAEYIREAQREAEERERRPCKRRTIRPPTAQAAATALAFVREYCEYNEVTFAEYVQECGTIGKIQDVDSEELEARVRMFGDVLQSVVANSDHSMFDEARRHHKNFNALEDLSLLQTTTTLWNLKHDAKNNTRAPNSMSDAVAQASGALDDALTNLHMDPSDRVVGTASYRPRSVFQAQGEGNSAV